MDDFLVLIIILACIGGGISISINSSSDDPNEVAPVVVDTAVVDTATVVAPVIKKVAPIAKVAKPIVEPKKPTGDVIVDLNELDTKLIDKKILDVEFIEPKVEDDAPLFIDLEK